MFRRLILTFVLAVAVPFGAARAEIVVAVASNFAAPAQELSRAFTAKTNQEIVLVLGSTGKLFAQIKSGAPFDAFLSADQERPEMLVELGQGPAFTYAVGRLVLWSASDTSAPGTGRDVLLANTNAYVALANPNLAPYGRAAAQVLAAWDDTGAVMTRTVQGQNVAQAQALVATGNAAFGFLSASLTQGQEGHVWAIPDELYDPILQDAIGLTAQSDAFLAFLQSEEARGIIARHGYDVPEAPK